MGPPVDVLFGVVETVPRPLMPLVQDMWVEGTGSIVWKNSEGGQDDENARTMVRFALLSLSFTVCLLRSAKHFPGEDVAVLTELRSLEPYADRPWLTQIPFSL